METGQILRDIPKSFWRYNKTGTRLHDKAKANIVGNYYTKKQWRTTNIEQNMDDMIAPIIQTTQDIDYYDLSKLLANPTEIRKLIKTSLTKQ